MAIAAAILPACAVAMSPPQPPSPARCHVAGGKLPAGVDASSICQQVERAIAHAAPKARYTVEIKVMSSFRLAAALVVDGRALPQQNFAISDSQLNEGAIERFAQSLAAAVAKAVRA